MDSSYYLIDYFCFYSVGPVSRNSVASQQGMGSQRFSSKDTNGSSGKFSGGDPDAQQRVKELAEQVPFQMESHSLVVQNLCTKIVMESSVVCFPCFPMTKHTAYAKMPTTMSIQLVHSPIL